MAYPLRRHANGWRAETADGEFLELAAEFDAAGLKAAILDSQTKGQHYRDFTGRAMQAGVQGYFAFLRGQRVTYFGRDGEQHTEWFPGAGPAASK